MMNPNNAPKPFNCAFLLRTCFIAAILLPVSAFSQLKIDGVYSGKNIYIQSTDEDCITGVFVNDVPQTDFGSAAVEVKLDAHDLAVGDSVHIVVNHNAGCRPKMLHTLPCIISPDSIIGRETVTPDGLLSWDAFHTQTTRYYEIQHYRWNRWDSVGVVTAGAHELLFKPAHLHPGDNRFRIVAVQKNTPNDVGNELHINCRREAVTMRCNKKERYIVFSAPTYYRLVDGKGNTVREGEEQSFRTDELPKGNYFVLFDDQTEKIRL